MTIGDVIREYRKNHALSQRKFADLSGLSNGYISMLEKNCNPNTNLPVVPSIQALRKIAVVMGITLHALCEQANDTKVDIGMVSENSTQHSDILPHHDLMPITTRRIPLLGNIACGEPILAAESLDVYLSVGENVQADFCLRAKGDSMTGARIYDGDIVFVRQQDSVDNGEIAVVLIDDEATLKRVQYDRANNILMLFPENPSYKPMVYTGERLNDVRILGKAVAFQGAVL